MQTQKAIEKFIQDRIRRGCAETSIQTYRDQLKLFQDYMRSRRLCRIERVTVRHLEDYLMELRARPKKNRNGRLSPVTVRKHALMLRSFFRFLKRARLVRTDPAARLHVPGSGTRKPKVLAPGQVRRLFDCARWTDDGKIERDYALLLLLLDSGVRLSEAAALCTEDFEFSRGAVHVKHGKGDKERWSVFTAQTGRALKKIVPPQGSAFGMSALAIYRAVTRRGRQTGVDVSPHRLRHTWLTEFLNNGGQIHVAMMLAGHDDIKTTIGYIGVALSRVASDYCEYSPLRLLNAEEK